MPSFSKAWVTVITVYVLSILGIVVFLLFIRPDLCLIPTQHMQGHPQWSASTTGYSNMSGLDGSLPRDSLSHVTPGEENIVVKRTYSSRLRLIYLVGLEGTGHHYMADVLDKLCNESKVKCPNVCKLARALYPGLGNPSTGADYKQAREDLRTHMEKLALDATRLPQGKATMVGFGSCRYTSGMMSYPNFNGDLKSLQYVDFRMLAEEAELAGIDLRMIYLARSARDILISDTKHNNYGSTFLMESRVLLANADVVLSTFMEIDPAFVTCFRYEDIFNTEQAQRVANFSAPTQYAADRFATTMLSTARNHDARKRKGRKQEKSYPDMSDPGKPQGMLVDRLQQKLNMLEVLRC